MPGNPVRNQRKTNARTLLDYPNAIDVICEFIAGGGTLTAFCREHDLHFQTVSVWIEREKERRERYAAAVDRRKEHNREVVNRALLAMADTDISQAYDKETNTLLKVHDMPESIRRAIASIEVEELFDGRGDDRRQIGVVTKVKLWDRNKSVETLARSLKMLTDKVEHGGKVTLADLVAGDD
ncbi:MAG: terminase small subunit [bacterium]|jgi:hypothetical protein